ncbi:DUF6011 domain-containing protein [Amycolatopsis sp. NPDC001319]|uniref:DUF6011 domain-containing protein n=1 Tax=unclassified Amycolatopsis TaxID=2618356 RepID=UPI00369A5969
MTTTATTAKCTRCGRTLRAAASVARGFGRHCQAKVTAAAKTTGHKPAQVAKAVELIEVGGIVPLRTRHTRVFAVVASDGVGRYLTAPQACNCKAGLRGVSTCYHRIAAELLAA